MRPRRSFNKLDITFVLLLCVGCIGLVYLPTGFEKSKPDNSQRAEAKVLDLDNSEVRTNLLIKTGGQKLTVKILDGPYQGQVARADNYLMGKMELDEFYQKGDVILLEFSVKDGKVKWATPRGRYRIQTELILIGLFSVFLVAIGGFTGVKALLSFIFAALMLWKVMVPVFLKGYDPVLSALGVVAVLTGVISFLVGGLSRKGLVAFSGAFLGLLTTCLLAQLFAKGFHVHGAVRPFAETLLYSGYYNLNLTRIFLAGIFIASSGAVMDLSMDIAASLHEVSEKRPQLTAGELMKSGMAVGRSVIGTMTTTLLLAYSGSYMAMLMLFMGQGIPLVNIFNLNYVAAEVLNTLVGSFGLVTVAPFTALVGGLVFSRKGRRAASS